MSAGQGMVQIEGNGLLVDGMNAILDNTPVRSRQFSRIADLEHSGGKTRFGELMKRLGLRDAKRLFRGEFKPYGIANPETCDTLW